jgi:hypothetical protein
MSLSEYYLCAFLSSLFPYYFVFQVFEELRSQDSCYGRPCACASGVWCSFAGYAEKSYWKFATIMHWKVGKLCLWKRKLVGRVYGVIMHEEDVERSFLINFLYSFVYIFG